MKRTSLPLQRREFITLLSGAVAWPLAASAQQRERTRRIAVFMPGVADDAEFQARNAAFLQGIGELGWTVGRNPRLAMASEFGSIGTVIHRIYGRSPCH
jgi:hypothetical protein